MKLPAVSVIIPMYNAEKYIGECLESILAQTFQDFEVIVVNDCSTDSSVEVVEGYKKFFGERLKIARTQKNSGNPGVPRNLGLTLSRGEYISFLDADDTITSTAFEELYSIAKKFDAEVVACERCYFVPEKYWNDNEFKRTLEPFSKKRTPLVTAPTFLTNNFFERVESYCQPGNFLWNAWSKLIRRDFIIENEITFASTIVDDSIFTTSLIFSAERFVLVPNVVNHYRVVEGSVSHTTEKGLAYFRKYVRALTPAFRYFDEFLSGKEFFRQNPDQKYLVLNVVWNEIFGYLMKMYDQFPAYKFDEIAREEFSEGDNVALMAFTFNIANLRINQYMQQLQLIEELEKTSRQDKAYIAELENLVAQLLNKG